MTLDELRASIAKDSLLQATDGEDVPLIVVTEGGPVNGFVSVRSYLRNEYSVSESDHAAFFGLNNLHLEDLMFWNLYCVPSYVSLLRWNQL